MLQDTYEIEQAGPVVVATLHGEEVGHHAMQELVEECLLKMRYDNARDFVIDLSGVKFLASACLGALVELLKDAEHQRGRVMLAGCCENVAFLFKVTKLDSVFELFDEVDDAKAAL